MVPARVVALLRLDLGRQIVARIGRRRRLIVVGRSAGAAERAREKRQPAEQSKGPLATSSQSELSATATLATAAIRSIRLRPQLHKQRAAVKFIPQQRF